MIHADAYKVVLAVADRATVFETRTWQPVYSVSLAGGSSRHSGHTHHERATAVHAYGSRLAVATTSGGVRMLEAEGLHPPGGGAGGWGDEAALAGLERSPATHLLRLWGSSTREGAERCSAYK